MSDHLDRAIEVIAAQMHGLTTPSMCRGIARALEEAGLLVTPERVAAQAEVERLRSAADSLLEKAFERGANGHVPAVNVVEISGAFGDRPALNPTEGETR